MLCRVTVMKLSGRINTCELCDTAWLIRTVRSDCTLLRRAHKTERCKNFWTVLKAQHRECRANTHISVSSLMGMIVCTKWWWTQKQWWTNNAFFHLPCLNHRDLLFSSFKCFFSSLRRRKNEEQLVTWRRFSNSVRTETMLLLPLWSEAVSRPLGHYRFFSPVCVNCQLPL